jgi:Cu-Zn family superoxide dismutase
MNCRLTMLLALSASFALAPMAATGKDKSVLARSALVMGEGTPAGNATIRQRGGRMVLEIDLRGIAPGSHGLHFHSAGQCGGTGAAFAGAGPHLNPRGVQHGTANRAGHHMGDLPNVTADKRGRIKTRIALGFDAAQLAGALFDTDGTALVVHAGPDDYVTDPSGNSGARIACGVLIRN